MKRKMLIVSLLLLVGGIHANLNKTESFVVVGDETYFCDEIYTGPSSFKVTTVNGDIMKIATGRIDAYAQNGMLFEKMPVVNKNRDTAGWAFMQFITSRDGYKLYRYCSNYNQYDPSTGEIAPEAPVYRYYIFRNGSYINVTDDHNVKALLMRFGVKVIS